MRALPKEQLSPETFGEYAADLADVDDALLEAAVTMLIRGRREPWFPTLGEIRAVCAELRLGLPTEAGALAQVEARIQWGRSGAGKAPAVHPLVADALRQVGGYPAFRGSEEPQATRGRFSRVYRDLRAATVKETAVDLSVRPALDGAPGVC